MKIKNIKKIMIFLLVIIMLLSLKSFAATTGSFSTSINSKEMKEGENISVSINTINCAGQFTVSSSNSSVASIDKSSLWVEGTETFTITANSAGTATISITATDVGDNQNPSQEVTGKKTITVTVKAKEQPTTPEPTPEPTPDPKPQQPTVTEPKFTSVNKTMYSTGEINLRASWSTSSSATKIPKGTELKVTGTSTEKVNGYVWYRVNYNGSTKYVASNLLTSTKPEEEKKSNNAYLKSLIIENQELLPTFNKETTEYTMQVKSDVTELNIKAEAEDEKASVSIQGNKDLKEGENTVTISVNAEDNTIKIYEIKVTKLKETALGLKTLTIKDTDISEKFKTDNYEYEIDIKDVEKLEIEAIATDETAIVEILGNEELQEGENLITIIVSSKNGEEKVTYQIKANKVVATNQTVENQEQGIDTKIYFYIAIGTILLIALIIVIVYTIKNRKKEEYDFSDNYEGFPEELPEIQEDYNQKNEQNKEINYENNEIQNDNIEENDKIDERKTKIDYFLDSEDDEQPKRRKGKHF